MTARLEQRRPAGFNDAQILHEHRRLLMEEAQFAGPRAAPSCRLKLSQPVDSGKGEHGKATRGQRSHRESAVSS